MEDEVGEVSTMAEESKTSPGSSGSAPEENVSVTLLVVRQLDRIEGNFERFGQRVDRLETSINQRMDRMETTLNQRMDRMDQRMDHFEQRVEGLYLWAAGTVVVVLVGAGAVVVTLLTHHP